MFLERLDRQRTQMRQLKALVLAAATEYCLEIVISRGFPGYLLACSGGQSPRAELSRIPIDIQPSEEGVLDRAVSRKFFIQN